MKISQINLSRCNSTCWKYSPHCFKYFHQGKWWWFICRKWNMCLSMHSLKMRELWAVLSIHPRFLCKTEITTTSICSWFVACEVTWMYRLFSILFKPICAPLIPTRWLTFTQCYNKSQYLTSNWLQALFFKKKFQVSIILECCNYVSYGTCFNWFEQVPV